MALTLDANLATAQGYQSRRPLVEILSAQRLADIPFDGAMLTSETFNEYGINMIPHSTGSLVMAYIYYSAPTSGIKFVYTDTSRTEFTTVSLALYTYTANEIKAVSICELTGGNIGMVLLVNDKANHLYRLTRRIYTAAGVAVSDAEIANWSHDTYTSDVWVQTIAANSYLIVYGKISGTDYYIYKRTSANFTTWAAEAQLTIGGLTATWRLANPSIVKITTGDLWLWFDVLESTGPGGEELTNIYYSVSANAGATWANAVKVTAYDTYGEVGLHPVAVQKAANQMNLIFTRKVGALHMQDTATGWPTGDWTQSLSWDSVNRKLYAVNSAGAYFQCVVKIDVDTWAVDQYWDTTTTPGFPSFLADGTHSIGHLARVHDGYTIAISCHSGNHRFIWILDGEANTITNLYLDTDAVHSIAANVTHSISADFLYIGHVQVDAANTRVWLCFEDDNVGHPKVMAGYIDYSEIAPEFTQIVNYTSIVNTEAAGLSGEQEGGMFVDTSGDYIVLSCSTGIWSGALMVFDITSGALLVKWNSTDTDFPYFGLTKPYVYDGKIYAGMNTYTSGYGQSSFRGLAEIDIATETITLHRPSYCSNDDHVLGRACYLQDGKIAMTHNGYGVAVFNTISKAWELFSDSNVPGFTIPGTALNGESQVAYDDTNDLIMVGDPGDVVRGHYGVIVFSIHGFMRQAYYSIGTDPGGGWTFATAAQLVQGYVDYDAVAAVEPGSATSMFVFWVNEDVDAAQSIKWDKDGSSFYLSSYIVGEVSFERSISGKSASLSFSVSHGHLFDPYNLTSLYNLYLKKGRKLTLRFGDKVGVTSYWANQGSYFVTATSLEFKRGEYPVMKVEAEDQRCLWAHSHIYVTDIYNNLPEDIITDILEDEANMATADINLPVFVGGTNLQMQWIETSIDEIINQVCNRYGYFFRFDMDGKAHARLITNAGAIDNTYTDSTKVLRYTPDDRYSDFTNRVTVQGQELSFTQITFEEERIATLSGTLGWWGCRADHTVWFSDDKSRRCVNPRLNVLETVTSIAFQLQGSVSEYLVECSVSDDNKFCTVYAEAPDLTPQLLAALSMIATGLALGDYALPAGGLTIPVGKVIESTGLIWALMILGSNANYQYEVWAQPLGQTRRSVQATWNDTEHQTEIDAIVEQKIQDPLCYSAADCLAVATFEGLVVQMQRKRIMIEKVAHLQDEEGDTIRVVHPYSGQTMDLFVASIKRKFKKAEPGNDDGYFLDEIEGWVVS